MESVLYLQVATGNISVFCCLAHPPVCRRIWLILKGHLELGLYLVQSGLSGLGALDELTHRHYQYSEARISLGFVNRWGCCLVREPSLRFCHGRVLGRSLSWRGPIERRWEWYLRKGRLEWVRRREIGLKWHLGMVMPLHRRGIEWSRTRESVCSAS